ncbi:glycosyltransferase [Clostridium sporogenes]|uniref:Glycosyltransferase n=1 Tax=Clostridium sporogenes TaxID=1509 RepID=A0A7X5P675_CLOSG|nr:glycosyltransferase [Clostridium sporogenes]AJD33100.1 methyltransferase domain protein [Clostridium botulinum Prevot_594]NFQ15403.1 glycosyltransferase [Clostridium sporogenes]NFQ19422.1 glycosyltransferase [Clostridium sporogenes]NFQ27946.1 glycosyltransferase [Clostridium sporogenes]NFR60131.1 glycosyltransferase [Clostridium sporogenes]
MEDINKYKIQVKNNIQKLINEGKLKEAKNLISEYEQNIKDDIDVISMKAVILIMDNELKEAKQILKYAISLEKTNPDILFNLAYIYEISEEYEKAYEYYSNAKNNSKDNEFVSNVENIINKLKKNLNFKNNDKEIKTSIVILTYNKLEYTKLCIDSIRKYTKSGTYEIIVVDNNSTDDTKEWLKEQNDIKLILNNENLGFPGGCNVGIKIAQKDNDILLLNNDTVVTPRWLENLKKCLYSDEYVGAVGAVTNNCANYQAIKTEYESIDEMIAFANKYNISDLSKWEQKVRLIGFCMLIKRVAIDKIGLLDEKFFPGNFEDDDLGYRIQSEGYKLMLCNDTFIHHFGSISFKENPEKFNKSLAENSKKFMNKWGFDSEKNSFVNFNIIKKIDKVKTNINVLHIGCGTGALLYKIKHVFKDAKLYGVDSSEITTKILRNFVNVKVSSIDDELYYPEDFFDYIIVTNSIEDSKAPRIALKKLLEFLKETGKIIVTIKNSNFYEEFIKILMGSTNFKYKNLYNYNEIKEMFSSKEFLNTIIQSQTVDITTENEMVIDHICKLTGENMKSQYITKEYLITFNKNFIDKKEIEYILRRIENFIDIEDNLKILNSYLDKIDYEVLNEIIVKNIIRKEEVFNNIVVDLYNNHKYSEALKILELSYKYNPKNKDTVYNISYIINQLGDKDMALSYLDLFCRDYYDRDILNLKKEILGDTNE